MNKLTKRIAALAMAATMAVTAAAVVTSADETETAETKYDFTVWANGKDVKANEKKGISEQLYKTATLDYSGLYSGGKWTVMTTTVEVNDVDAFMALFDEKGKLTADAKADQKEAKNIASAKLKEGTITVTAGKEAGEFNVWLYEVKNKAVVNTDAIKPVKFAGIAKAAANSIVVVETADKAGTAVDKKTDALKEIGVTVGAETVVYVADTKNAVDADATYTVESASEKVTASIDGKAITVSATEAVKSKITITNTESGKKVNVTVKATAAAEEPVVKSYKIKILTDETTSAAYKLYTKNGDKFDEIADESDYTEGVVIYYADANGDKAEAVQGTHYELVEKA